MPATRSRAAGGFAMIACAPAGQRMHQPPIPPFELTREAILDGSIRRRIEAADPTLKLMSETEQRASLAAMLAERPDGPGDVWLFAYGSLIWNPTIHAIERQVAAVRGYHRRFCLWTRMGRGTDACPGLTLGLERGGSCRGVAYRIAAASAETELEVVWRREMITDAYRPRWLRMTTAHGPGWALGFLINRGHPRYAGLLSEARIAEAIAAARGPLGACATYLFNTIAHLEALGIRDQPLTRLRDQVVALQRQAAELAP
jgi:glutathione-specific gamma-glutamylcyclotransferase